MGPSRGMLVALMIAAVLILPSRSSPTSSMPTPLPCGGAGCVKPRNPQLTPAAIYEQAQRGRIPRGGPPRPISSRVRAALDPVAPAYPPPPSPVIPTPP
ncbi:hypothetical protein Taro_055332 [Colocasia esculenta]|uniref:Uncharacterized protein n=1 Tax=Colocasia esculenta TaxID=4460 RepID=A0A843XTB1_COLES|nr:hypothetical protein [Colocasia esculenta]